MALPISESYQLPFLATTHMPIITTNAGLALRGHQNPPSYPSHCATQDNKCRVIRGRQLDHSSLVHTEQFPDWERTTLDRGLACPAGSMHPPVANPVIFWGPHGSSPARVCLSKHCPTEVNQLNSLDVEPLRERLISIS